MRITDQWGVALSRIPSRLALQDMYLSSAGTRLHRPLQKKETTEGV